MSLLQNSNAIETAEGGYNINNSLRFRRSASARLSRTFASSSGTTNTWSFWVKRGTLGVAQHMFSWTNLSTTSMQYVFDAGDTFTFANVAGGAVNAQLTTTQVFRDPSAWYHIVFVLDTTQATAANRLKLYVNGVQVTAFSTATYPAQNTAMAISTSAAWAIGARGGANDIFFDGYMSEFNFIDGQALTPSSFGETDTDTGVWKPKAYTSTYGTNGFYLNFSDIATTSGSNAGLGKDFSGNANYWNTNNISVTSGVTYDAMTDSPTLTSPTVANYAVMNPLGSATSNIFINANLSSNVTAVNTVAKGSIFARTGKWYCEFTVTAMSGGHIVGIATPATSVLTYLGSTADAYGYSNFALKYNNAVTPSYGTTWAVNNVIGIALDLDAGTLTFYKNNVSQGVAYTGISGEYTFAYSGGTNSSVAVNFGQRPFAYTPPTGFLALNTFNLPTSTVVKGNSFMDATTYTGNGTTQSIANAASFRPDFVWIKSRSSATAWNNLYDSIRGVTKQLYSNATNAESTVANSLTSFNANGFSVGVDTGTGNFGWNTNAATYVGWQWQAGQGTTSTNTDGSITSTVSANTTAGFSVVTYTSNSGTVSTVGHGLGVAPSMLIFKNRTLAGTNWVVYHKDLGNTKALFLNLTNAPTTNSTYFNNTSPTSTVFTISSSNNLNNSTNAIVCYAWAEIEGFSKFGSYTGNGSTNGTFVYLGFRPKFVLIKNSGAGAAWRIYDTSRSTINVSDQIIIPNTSGAETSGAAIDILSNGFKLRNTANNGSANTYIYAAFAENPFKNSLAR